MLVCRAAHGDRVHQSEGRGVHWIAHHTHFKHEIVGGVHRTGIEVKLQCVHRIQSGIDTGKYGPLRSVCTGGGKHIEPHTVRAGGGGRRTAIDNRITAVAGAGAFVVVHPTVGQIVG